MNKAIPLFLLSVACLLAGCQRTAPSWLRGNWVLDGDYTASKIAETKRDTSNSDADSSRVGKAIASGLTAMRDGLLVPVMIEQVKQTQMTLTVTGKEVFLTAKNGDAKAHPYEVMDAPNADTAILKETTGDTTTYHRDGERMWTSAGKDIPFPVYYSRAPAQ